MKNVSMLMVVCALGCSSSEDTGTPAAGQTLPDCGGNWPAEWVAKEQAVRDQFNALRAQTGTCGSKVFAPAQPVVEDPVLTLISRCFARDQALAGSNALQGSAADTALADRVQAAKYPGTLTGYAGDLTAATPEEIIAGFLANQAQCEALWDPTTTVGSVGYVAYPQGNVPQLWAGITAAKASN